MGRKGPKPLNRILACIGVLILVFAAVHPVSADQAAGKTSSSKSDPKRARALLIPKVETVISGEIAARINAVRVDVGDGFKRGQVLVVLDCGLYKAQLDKARAELKEATKTLEVNQRLEKLGSVSELEVAVAAANVDKAKAEVASSEDTGPEMHDLRSLFRTCRKAGSGSLPVCHAWPAPP